MKNSIRLTLFLFLATALSLQAQISEESKSMSDGIQNALVLELPNTSKKFVGKLWKKYLKDFKGGKSKKNKKQNEIFTENIKITEISDKPIDLYSRITQIGDDVELSIWINLGGAYLSSTAHPKEYLEAEKFLMRFALDVTKEKIKIEIEEEENKLKKLEKTLKKLKRANDNYHREIEQAKEKIKKAEKNIEDNEADQENTQELIEEQKQAVLRVKKKLEDL